MSDIPKFVQINEEGPREGFQFEKGPIPTERKIELIDALSETGLNHIQVASFVNPKRVPGLADADEMVQRFKRKPGVHYTALWLNRRAWSARWPPAAGHRGLDLADRVGEVPGAQPAAHDGGQHRSSARDASQLYKQHGIPLEARRHHGGVRLQLRGRDPAQRVLDMIQQLLDIAAEHGVKPRCSRWPTRWPGRRRNRSAHWSARCATFPDLTLSLHLHDTRGMGIANAYAGLEMGVAIFDASVAGLGGCPFAAHKGAAGNVCTEDLVFMLRRDGHRDRHRPRQADRGRAAGRGHRRPSAARLGEDGRQPEGAAGKCTEAKRSGRRHV